MDPKIDDLVGERPPTPWMQFVVDSFEEACAISSSPKLSARGVTVILNAGPELDADAALFPFRIVIASDEGSYAVLVKRISPRWFGAVVHRIALIVPVKDPPETETWHTTDAELKQIFSEPILGTFARLPDDLASQAIAIIRSDWYRRFGGDDRDDGDTPDSPPVTPPPRESRTRAVGA